MEKPTPRSKWSTSLLKVEFLRNTNFEKKSFFQIDGKAILMRGGGRRPPPLVGGRRPPTDFEAFGERVGGGWPGAFWERF